MPIKIQPAIVVGRHRSAQHAERHRRRLAQRPGVKSATLLARRNEAGKYSKRGHVFYFQVTPEETKLFRLSVGITYPSKGEYLSYMLQHWQRNKTFSQRRQKNLTELVTQGLEKELGYPRGKFWFNLERATGIEMPAEVLERANLAGTYELTSEDPDAETTGTYPNLREVRAAVKNEWTDLQDLEATE